MTRNQKEKFGEWVESLKDRILASGFRPKFRRELISFLRDPRSDDAILAKISVFVEDDDLQKDLISTILVLDGTLRVRLVADDGRPMEFCE